MHACIGILIYLLIKENNNMIRKITLVLLVFGMVAFMACSHTNTPADSARVILENEELEVYHGWIKYLVFDVEVAAKRPGVDEAGAIEKQQRLETWIRKIQDDPDIIRSLRGVQEWAYESPVDGSGQPFMINIPQDYNSENAMPLSLYMHGYSGNHSEHFVGNDQLIGMFEVSVLGRSRGGGYVGLSGADVIHVLDYIESNWNIDADHIHLLGGSMGGQGTFRMGIQYPHRFASARPTCGFASHLAYGNLVTLPVYATHSDDDYVVPIALAGGPMERLQELGGQAIFDQTTGFGHAVWSYTEGNNRSDIWFRQQTRPDSRDVKHLNFTAFDGTAMRSWWAEIEAWGSKPKPASFVLTADDNNTLYAKLTNIQQLKLRLDESPFDLEQTLFVSVNDEPVITMESPLPNVIYISRHGDGWQLVDDIEKPSVRRHTPGGPNLLYNGDPLLIVYGTMGSQEEKEAMLTAAEVASKSSNAMWPKPNGDKAGDSIDHNQNLYGNLVFKADTEVSDEDVKRSHLVLIGTESQNRIVASIAKSLPVSLSGEKITFTDGESYPAEGLGLGLIYFNPEAPENLIFWVASNDIRLYSENSPIPLQMTFLTGIHLSSPPGYDCLISNADRPVLIAARNFDNAWNWIPRDGIEELISSSINTRQDFFTEMSKAIKAETAADFVFTLIPQNTAAGDLPFRPGVTLLDDLVTGFYFEPIVILYSTGFEILEMKAKLEAIGQDIYPSPILKISDLDKTYKLAVNQSNIWPLVRNTEYTPGNYRLTDFQVSDAVRRFFPRE
jgi:hypothetical protein